MIPFPKIQNDSSIEDVSLKQTRQATVKKEPKSNATWDFWSLKCQKMTLPEKKWKMWDQEVNLWKPSYVKIAIQSEVMHLVVFCVENPRAVFKRKPMAFQFTSVASKIGF